MIPFASVTTDLTPDQLVELLDQVQVTEDAARQYIDSHPGQVIGKCGDFGHCLYAEVIIDQLSRLLPPELFALAEITVKSNDYSIQFTRGGLGAVHIDHPRFSDGFYFDKAHGVRRSIAEFDRLAFYETSITAEQARAGMRTLYPSESTS